LNEYGRLIDDGDSLVQTSFNISTSICTSARPQIEKDQEVDIELNHTTKDWNRCRNCNSRSAANAFLRRLHIIWRRLKHVLRFSVSMAGLSPIVWARDAIGDIVQGFPEASALATFKHQHSWVKERRRKVNGCCGVPIL
jgi:hypothetical protein